MNGKTLIIGARPGRGDNYLAGLEELLTSGALGDLHPGGAYRLLVVHSDGCGIFAGRRCDCEPEFELKQEVA
jgi:hypothetical protein